AAKNDKRKFKVLPKEKMVFNGSSVYFSTEYYNDLLEKIYNREIILDLKNERGEKYSYKYNNTESPVYFEVKGLKPGIYSYTAKSGKDTYVGQFTVKDIVLEDIQSNAEHNALKQLSQNNNGKYFYTDF